MPRKPRSEILRPGEQAIAHVMNRCVRKCFLMANGYRRREFELELEKAAGGFGIDLLSYAIMDNHFHLILRSRPDIVKEWTDLEVVKHWHKLCPIFKDENGVPVDNPTDEVARPMTQDTAQVETWRERLSDISWLMKLVSERIAKFCNIEDNITGHFWEGRFKCVLLLDERALIACSAYVDLNRIEAELAASLEESDYTSIQRRIIAAAIRTSMQKMMAKRFTDPTSIATTAVIDPKDSDIPDALAAQAGQVSDDHLSPLQIDEKNDPIGPHLSQNAARCSDKGFLPMTQDKYIELLEWSADQIRHRHQGQAFDDSPPILEAMKMEPDVWCKLVTRFPDLFYCVAGSPESIDAHRSFSGKSFHMPKATREMLTA